MLIDRYLVREIGTSFLAVAVVLTVIFLAYSMTLFLTDAASGLIKTEEVARLTLLKSIIALEVLVPLALYFGLIIGFGRMNTHAELTAMQAAGISRARLQRPLIVCSLLLATLVAVFSFTVRPAVYEAMFALKAQADASSDLDRIKAQRFYLDGDEHRAIYIESLSADGRELGGVFIRNRRGAEVEVISAPSGQIDLYASTTHHRLNLSDASVYRSADNSTDFYGSFGSLSLLIEAGRTVVEEYRTKAARTIDLFDAVEADDRAELQWRLSTPVSTLLLALTALALTELRPQQSRFSRLPLALGVYALYYNLLVLARTWVEQNQMSTIWWVPGLLGLALLSRHLAAYARRRS